MKVAVAGASGYAGGELLRLLLGHPDLEIGPVAAGQRAGALLGSVHPQLPLLADRRLGPTDADFLGTADLVFLALPHGESAALVRDLGDTPIVDLGADFRLRDAAAWTGYYGGTHAGSWGYGLPELAYADGSRARTRVASASKVANPGCYPTSVILGLAPLCAAGLVVADDIVVVAASGTSGAGRKASESLLASEVMGSMSAYKVGGTHQHTPEIEQALFDAGGAPVRVSFTPMLAPMPRGILATCTARLAADVTTELLHEALYAAYAAEPFIRVCPPGHWPTTAHTAGSNAVHIQVAADRHSGRAVVVSALDNLVKGAAGQAVQNANIMLGLDETAGLSSAGVAP